MYVIYIVLAVAEIVMLEVQGTPVSLSNVFAQVVYCMYRMEQLQRRNTESAS